MNSNNEMSFLDHLEELRWNIIRSLVAVMVMACVCFICTAVGIYIIKRLINSNNGRDF